MCINITTHCPLNLLQVNTSGNRLHYHHYLMFLVFCPLCYLQVCRSGMIFFYFYLLLYLPERASPLCRTSSIFATIILWTSCSSVLMLPKFLLALLSTYAFFVFWMYVSGTIYVLDISLVNGFVPSAKTLKDTVS